jgi:uncharacterized protein (TIGR01244 family)
VQIKRLTERLTMSPQLEPADFQELASAGVHMVLNNRPDGEAPGQLSAAEAARLATAASIDYRHIPVTFATLQAEDIDRFGRALEESSGPVHAHCRSGIRSANLWMLDQVRRGLMDREQAISWAEAHQLDIRDGLAWLDRQTRASA